MCGGKRRNILAGHSAWRRRADDRRFFVARSEVDDRFLARARVRRFSFFPFTPSPLCRKLQIDSAISVKTFGPNASPAGEAHDRTQVHPNLHP